MISPPPLPVAAPRPWRAMAHPACLALFLLLSITVGPALGASGPSVVAHRPPFAPLPASQPGAPRGATGTLFVEEPETPDTLNPYLAHSQVSLDITSAVFDSLLSILPNGSPRPNLAQRWGRSADGLRWTFWLNPAARWQDGLPVTARDVLYTARLVTNPAFGATSTAAFSHIKTLSSVGDDQVTIQLDTPYAPFAALFGTAPILPAHVLEPLSPAAARDYAAFTRRPVGSGPFAVTEFVPGDHVTLVRTHLSDAPPVGIQRLIYQRTPTRDVALAALRAGGAVVLPPTLNLTAAEYLALRRPGATGVAIYATPGFSWMHVDLVESGFLREGAVRRALVRATPRQRIVDEVLLGLGAVAVGDQPPSTRWFEPGLRGAYSFDPAAARRGLRALGFLPTGPGGALRRGGAPLAITLWAVAGAPGAERTARLIATGWRSVGVAVTVQLAPAEEIFGPRGPLLSADRLRRPAMNAVLYSWTNPPDPDDAVYWHSAAVATPDRPAAMNFVGYHSPVVDRLIVAAQAERNLQTRAHLYQRIQRLLAYDQPAIYIAWPHILSATTSHLRGYQPNPYQPGLAWNARLWTLDLAAK